MKTLTKGVTIRFRRLLAVTLLFSSSFVWFYLLYTYLGDIISPDISSFWLSVGTVIFLVSIGVSAFFGSAMAGRVKRRKLLLAWLFAGVIVTVLVLFFRGDEFFILWAIVAGLTFGVGFPSCQAFLSDATIPDERGRVAGLTILTTFILVAFSLLAISALNLDSTSILLLAILIKSLGFISFVLDPIDTDIKASEPKPWSSILGYRDFYLYLVPYLLFMIAAGLVSLFWKGLPSSEVYDDAFRLGSILRLIGLSAFAMVAGLMADRIGRKKPIILGLVMLAVSYALVGLLTTPETYFINLVLSGCAWGIVIVIYLVVPGDLAFSGSTERFYTLGWVLPLLLWSVVYATGNFLNIKPTTDIFSFILTIVIIASIFPLFSAVETLSESKMRERRLSEYAEKVSKTLQES